MQELHRQKYRLSHDALYNLHELVYDLNGFVHKVITYPDLIVVCGNRTVLKECNRLLSLRQQMDAPQLMSYDTTFQLGDFYVSPLLFRNTLFKKSPVMPAIFLIHERKLSGTHKEMMMLVAKELPYLVNGNTHVPLVSDDERGFFDPIDLYLPNVRRLLCWNHTINAIKQWLRNHGAISKEIPVYVTHIRELFHQPNETDYYCKLEELKINWSESFLKYYMDEIHHKVNNICTLPAFIE